MAAGMLDAGVDMGNLMSDKCNKLLTTVIVSHSQSQGSGSGVGTIPNMSGEARGALHTLGFEAQDVFCGGSEQTCRRSADGICSIRCRAIDDRPCSSFWVAKPC